ncbi:MAG: multidrug effflux MFS transporter [Pseudomonadota bacterium]
MAAVSAAALNMFLPSLPKMADDFGVSYGIIQFAIAGYLFLTAFAQLIIGPLSDRYGRRPVALWTFGIFALASVGTALATSVIWFFIFRFLQATAVAGFVLSRAIIRDVHGPKNSASVIGYVTMGMALIPMVAPIFGGFLDDTLGWRATFWALALFGAGLTFLVFIDSGETNTLKNASFMEQFKGYPELFRSKRFWGYAMTGAFSVGAFFAYLTGAPLIGTKVFGMTPSQLGLAMGIPPTGYLIGNGLSGLLASRVGLNRMIMAGTIVQMAFLGCALIIALIGVSSPWVFFAFLAGIGLGNGLILPSATTGVLNVRPHLAGSASGLSGAVATLAGAVFSAFVAGILEVNLNAVVFAACIFGSAVLGFTGAVITAYWCRKADAEELRRATAETSANPG